MPKYRIIDEPRPGVLARVAVEPFWPLLASMLAGPWIGWPWFVLNAFAIGSPRRWWILLTSLAAILVTTGLALLLVILVGRGTLEGTTQVQLGKLGLVTLKLAVAYVLHVMQARDVALFEYYRGTLRNGLFVVIAVFLAGDRLLTGLPDLARLVLQ